MQYTRNVVPFTTIEEWKKQRSKDITSTEVSILFGLNPRKTLFQLWHEKKSGKIIEIEETERMKWGKRMEPVVAQGTAEDYGWIVEPFKDYISIPELRIGSSFDYKIIEMESDKANEIFTKANIPLEVKTVDRQFYKTWFNKDGELEAPYHIELQVQHQMLVGGFDEAYLVVMFSGNEAHVLHRTFNQEIANAVVSKCAEFWAKIESNEPYAPDYEADAGFIKELYANAIEGSVYDASQDDELKVWAGELVELRKEASFLKTQEEAKKAQILERINTAETVNGKGWKLTAKVQKKAAYTVKAQESRVLRVSVDEETSGTQTQNK